MSRESLTALGRAFLADAGGAGLCPAGAGSGVGSPELPESVGAGSAGAGAGAAEGRA
jgi:hypothetical protein